MRDIHSHVSMLTVNMTFFQPPPPFPQHQSWQSKLFQTIYQFLWKMQHIHRTKLCFFGQYVTEDNTIAATLLHNFFAKQFRVFFSLTFYLLLLFQLKDFRYKRYCYKYPPNNLVSNMGQNIVLNISHRNLSGIS